MKTKTLHVEETGDNVTVIGQDEQGIVTFEYEGNAFPDCLTASEEGEITMDADNGSIHRSGWNKADVETFVNEQEAAYAEGEKEGNKDTEAA